MAFYGVLSPDPYIQSCDVVSRLVLWCVRLVCAIDDDVQLGALLRTRSNLDAKCT